MFYTILPQWPLIKPRFKRIVRFAPLIGVLIGFLQSFFLVVLKYFDWPTISVALICVATNILITGGLHYDGLMDTADGMGAGPSKRIEAMKDSSVGAMGVQSLLITIILQIAAVVKLDFYAAFAFPVAAFWGRLSQLFAIENYEYIFKRESLSFHHQHWKGISKEIRPSLIILSMGIILFLLLTNLNITNILLLMFCISSGFITSILTPKLINKSLGGLSGDGYGAGLVITETANLLILSVILVPN